MLPGTWDPPGPGLEPTSPVLAGGFLSTESPESIKKNENHGIQSYCFTANRWGNHGNSDRLYWAPKSLRTVTTTMKLKDTCSLEEKQ